MSINIDDFLTNSNINRYQSRIDFLKKSNLYTQNIEETVEETIKNLFEKNVRNLVIYGEPQSGKTELMIALTAKLLDMGKKHIIIVVHDNVKLLGQNLTRFVKSGLTPSPMEHDEFARSSAEFKDKEFVVCSKKNKSNLEKLIEKIGSIDDVVVIDDECDHSTPNSKVNKEVKSKINELIEKVFSKKGHWIGVSATPGRVDVNNTFENDNQRWVSFKPHPYYYGQDHFFPLEYLDYDDDGKPNDDIFNFNFYPLKDSGPDNTSETRDALFRYMIRVAIKSIKAIKEDKNPECFSMIVHTSGEKESHKRDFGIIEKVFNQLNDEKKDDFRRNLERINDLIPKINSEIPSNEILHFINRHKQNYKLVVMNSDKDLRSPNVYFGLNPETTFTIVIGGNIISRGLTFNNLLSMYFSRDVKNKITIDTYVQRARMFGPRANVYNDFELAIPRTLYDDWWTAFYNHRGSLVTVNNFSSPIWMSDSRTQTTAPSSINKGCVDVSKGEFGFQVFELNEDIEKLYKACTYDDKTKEDLERLAKRLGDNLIKEFCVNQALRKMEIDPKKVQFQNIRKKTTDMDGETLIRKKGGVIDPVKGNPNYQFAMFKNEETNKARIFFKCSLSKKYLQRIK